MIVNNLILIKSHMMRRNFLLMEIQLSPEQSDHQEILLELPFFCIILMLLNLF